jgi:scyllo-inositol 2-dehydrogenase (NADP+)
MNWSNRMSTNGQPIRVGVVGLGRSGWNIHAKTILSRRDRFILTAVTDPAGDRRAEAVASSGCRAYEDFEGLVNDKSIELIVVASPNKLHTEHAITAMRAGKHVVCEKPFALTTDDADRMIDASEQADRVLVPFQNRRYEPHLLKVKEVMDSGVLGEIVQVRVTWHLFGRRWDWQTLRDFGGGSLNNNGSHLLDHALYVFGDGEPQVWADLKRTPLTSGDAEDHVKIVLYGEGHPTVDMELTNAAAYPQDRWHVMSSSGGLRGGGDHLEWKWVDLDAMPPRPVDRRPAEGRAYNNEPLEWRTETWSAPTDARPAAELLYCDVYDAIRHARPHPITPQSVRRLIRVMEQCRELCPV